MADDLLNLSPLFDDSFYKALKERYFLQIMLIDQKGIFILIPFIPIMRQKGVIALRGLYLIDFIEAAIVGLEDKVSSVESQ